MYDVTIIGAGVIGASIARDISKYELNACVIEKAEDVSSGTSKANSAIIHAGYDANPESMKGKLNAKGNAMFDKLKEELDFPFKRNGSFVLCFEKENMYKLENLKRQGELNGVPNLKILSKEEILDMEPNISEEVVAALYAPTGGIVCPYELTIALSENACKNGVEFKLNTKVENIIKKDDRYIIKTNNGDIESKVVINAAGVFADEINNMVSEDKIQITPRRGEYCLFDKAAGDMINGTIFQLPTDMGKGVLVTPTVDGNLLVGPNAMDIDDKEDFTTSKEGLDDILKRATKSVKNIPMNQIITNFSGLRAHSNLDDFIIGEARDAKNFVNAAGIESPGLSSAPAISEVVLNIVIKTLNPSLKSNFDPIRKSIPKFREMNNDERRELIAKDPKYGKIICRCELITEGEILDSIKGPLGATTLDGVKRRTRAGMGRCQGGFCSSRIVDILSKELNVPVTMIKKNKGNSNILVSENKEGI
ncbi:NAD(P)/FAD-dependent oxidoreductase [Clostridium algidicarnis]|uniref:Glycerol-3-phosphate dehydrogenase n=2 Tax=Clostridium algidicarnis TaxID=37659 RepID=A0A2S6FWG2_9CLOT|nr:NAD(P)/FAD-dependent oxidoreductase [Clostridium algidicarnis]MBB6632025.1 NAD(P)/FAD-dependent oxidoreductase [Clostridium algidicarnis]MBB6697305.1 NAD(P)/FAD-dependent oxidoreductase [Clostridium algidicarnis]MBU3194570.1 NAD(P)/FAD-dependent oxidoreductase [Clostridium algidicarnis]MBU3219111.1 NAD(P)/FAD-dependent oxidoreductase [Clostridium algidicarnis]PPK47925.1 glycerol-3-phosphate dehydrogenase [Clostridium algidicarnis DSM 15099]